MDRNAVPTVVRIDLYSLRHFADTLKSDADIGLRPGLDRARHEALTGVRFGARSVSGEVVAGAEAMAAEILVQAANKVLANYAKADLASAEQLAAVETTLREAAATVAKKYEVVRPPHREQPL